MKNINYYDFEICKLGIAEVDKKILRILFVNKNEYERSAAPGSVILDKDAFIVKETPLIKNAAAQLNEYFNGKRRKFDFPVMIRGTDFQIDVWKALQKIPYGETRSYGEIAAIIGNPKASRAVGMANNRNPLPIVVPCHRVIGSNGKPVGYAGGLELKQILLEIEKNKI